MAVALTKLHAGEPRGQPVLDTYQRPRLPSCRAILELILRGVITACCLIILTFLVLVTVEDVEIQEWFIGYYVIVSIIAAFDL